MEQPDVSVIVPIYNMEKSLRQCLDSIAAQPMRGLEVICVNDGSTDASLSIIREYVDRDERFKLLDKPNTGYGDSMNQGIALATGRYIGIVEADDWIDPALYTTLVDAAKRHGYPDVVKASYWRVCNPDTPEQQILPSFYSGEVSFVDTPFTIDQDAMLITCHPSIWTAIYRRVFLQDEGISFVAAPGGGWVDNPFMLEALVCAQSIVYIDRELYYYREFNVGSSSLVKDPSIISKRWIEMDDFLKRKGVEAKKIREAHYSRGCAYIKLLDEDFPHNAQAQREAQKIIDRLDYNTVLQAEGIIQPNKDAYQRHFNALQRLSYRLKRR
jgi:glycosyltransferase involved in cell wall biosynthesis